MVGAGVLSVLIYPALAVALARRERRQTGRAGAVTATAAAGEPGVATAADGAWTADGAPGTDGAHGAATNPGTPSGPGTAGSPGIDGAPGIEEAPGAPAG